MTRLNISSRTPQLLVVEASESAPAPSAISQFGWNLVLSDPIGVVTAEMATYMEMNAPISTARTDRAQIATIPSNYFAGQSDFYQQYYGDYSGAGAGFPDMPVNDTMRFLYFCFRYTAARSMGQNGVDSIPTTWRNLSKIERIYLQRNDLTSAQQLSLLADLEREAEAGMGAAYSGLHYIYFDSAAAGRNDSLITATLLTLGWVAISATRLEKTLNNGSRWRVQHL